MPCRGIRGATTADSNTREDILASDAGVAGPDDPPELDPPRGRCQCNLFDHAGLECGVSSPGRTAIGMARRGVDVPQRAGSARLASSLHPCPAPLEYRRAGQRNRSCLYQGSLKSPPRSFPVAARRLGRTGTMDFPTAPGIEVRAEMRAARPCRGGCPSIKQSMACRALTRWTSTPIVSISSGDSVDAAGRGVFYRLRRGPGRRRARKSIPAGRMSRQ